MQNTLPGILEKALSECKENADKDGHFIVKDRDWLNACFELVKRGYVKRISDYNSREVMFRLDSSAHFYENYKAEADERSSTMTNNTINNNFYGEAGRVYVNSTDNSTNISMPTETSELLEQILSAIKENDLENKEVILSAFEDMKQAVNKPTYKEKFNTFIQSVASDMTIFAPFIERLSALRQIPPVC